MSRVTTVQTTPSRSRTLPADEVLKSAVGMYKGVLTRSADLVGVQLLHEITRYGSHARTRPERDQRARSDGHEHLIRIVDSNAFDWPHAADSVPQNRRRRHPR